MSEKKETKITSNPFLFRYAPNCRFIYGAFKEQSLITIRKDEFGDSITDKQAYRLTLASQRGKIAAGGSNIVGVYMYPDGVYDSNKDFSYMYRKDLSIVDIDEYIKNKTKELEVADEKLKVQIEKDIAEAQKAKENLNSKSESYDSDSAE